MSYLLTENYNESDFPDGSNFSFKKILIFGLSEILEEKSKELKKVDPNNVTKKIYLYSNTNKKTIKKGNSS